MNADAWRRVSEMFHAAVALEPAERAAYISSHAAGEPEIAAAVSDLLRAEADAGSFLEDPVRLSDVFPQRPALAEGALLCQRFRIVRLLGAGGMGEVFEAEDCELGVRVALKTIKPEIAGDPAVLERFRREVRLARTVTHPNICRTFDIAKDTVSGQDVVFLTMEFLAGETLSHRLHQHGALDEEQTRSFAVEIAAALEAAHARGIIHRDIKPQNIFLQRDGDGREHAIVTDFGLARLDLPSVEQGADLLTNAHEAVPMIGTLAYMAPEQVHGAPATAQTDMYAFGLVLYEMLTGERPFRSSNPLSVVSHKLTATYSPARSQTPALQPWWDDLIDWCLRPAMEDRPQNAAAVLASLQRQELRPKGASASWVRSRTIALLVAGAICVSLLAWFFRFLPAGRASAPAGSLVYIAPLKNQTALPQLDGIGPMMKAALQQSTQIELLDSPREADLLQAMRLPADAEVTEPIGREVAMRAGAARVVFVSVTGSGANCSLDVEVQQPDSTPRRSRRKWGRKWRWACPQSTSGTLSPELLAAVRDASDWVREEVGESTDDIARLNAAPEDVTTPDWSALADYAYAEKLSSQQKREEAVATLHRATEKDPHFALAYARMGDILANMARERDSINAYRKALDLDDSSRLTVRDQLRLKGYVALDTRDYKAAEIAYRDYTLYYPHDASAWFRAAMPLFYMGRVSEAIEALKQAHAFSPSMQGPAYQLVNMSMAIGRWQDVDAYLDILRREYPRPLYLFSFGAVQVVRGDLAGAGRSFTELISSDPPALQWADAELLANVQAERGEFASAISTLSAQLANSPDNAMLLLARASLYCRTQATDACLADVAAAGHKDQGPTYVIAVDDIIGTAFQKADARSKQRFVEVLHGLAARQYSMADSVAARIAGERTRAELSLATGNATKAIQQMRTVSALDASVAPRDYLARALEAQATHATSGAAADGLRQEAADIYAKAATNPAAIWAFSLRFRPGFYSDQVDSALRICGGSVRCPTIPASLRATRQASAGVHAGLGL